MGSAIEEVQELSGTIETVPTPGGGSGQGGEPVLEPLNAVENGSYMPGEGVDGFSEVNVAVPIPAPVLQELTVTENGEYMPDEGVDGFSRVNVEVAAEGGEYSDPDIIALAERTVTDFTIPDGCKAIGNSFFRTCRQLVNVTIPDSVTSIGSNAFESCWNLGLTKLPDGITHIGDTAFASINNLKLSCLPESLEHIGKTAFGYSGLSIEEIPKNVISIANGAFNGCTKLTTLTFKCANPTIGATAFQNCTNLSTINVPWAEGEVANAPWGAVNATINYNYVEEG